MQAKIGTINKELEDSKKKEFECSNFQSAKNERPKPLQSERKFPVQSNNYQRN